MSSSTAYYQQQRHKKGSEQKIYISKGRIVPISDKLVESVDTEIDGVLRIASQPATTMKKSL
jgi:hypothetical protein